MIFEVVANKGDDSYHAFCEDKQDLNKESKELYDRGFKIMVVYGFNDTGFVKRVTYLRGKESWIILK